MFKKISISHFFIISATLAVFFLPLVVLPHSVFPFILPKAFLLQFLAIVAGLAAFFGFVYYPGFFKLRKSFIPLLVLFFYAAIFLSACLGVDFWRSVWSRGERMVGLFALFHYLLFFIVWVYFLTKEEWLMLWRWFVRIGMLVLLLAIVQLIFPQFLYNFGSDRVASTLGNPVYLGNFALFLFFSSACFYFSFKKEDIRRWEWLGASFLSLFILFNTQTRGAIIGLLAGIVVTGGIFLLEKNHSALEKKVVSCLIAFVVMFPVAILIMAYSGVTPHLPVVNRFVSAIREDSTRVVFWKMAYLGWKERPWTGWGWENFYDLANAHYLPELLRFGAHEEWVDNAHNTVLNTLATTGIMGVVAYVALYGVLFFVLFKKYYTSTSAERVFVSGLISFLVAHFVANLFAFEDQVSYLTFFWVVAGATLLSTPEREPLIIPFFHKKEQYLGGKNVTSLVRFVLSSAMVVGSITLLYRFTFLPAKADNLAAEATTKAMVDFKQSLVVHARAIQIPNPYVSDIYLDFGQFLLTWLNQHPDFPFSQYRLLSQDMYRVGVSDLKKYLALYPKDVRAAEVLGRSYVDGYDFWQNPKYLMEAEEFYTTHIIPFSSKRQTILFSFARVKFLLEKKDEALKIAETALSEDPQASRAQILYALLLTQAGEKDRAAEHFIKAFVEGYSFSQEEAVVAFPLMVAQNKAMGEEMMKKTLDSTNRINKKLIQEYIDFLVADKRIEEANRLNRAYFSTNNN